MSRPAVRIPAVSQGSPADRWISRVAAGTVAALAGLAGAISYSHMRQLALGHGQAGWHAHAFPLSVDGLELVASLVLLSDRRHGRPVRLAALLSGILEHHSTEGHLTVPEAAPAGTDLTDVGTGQAAAARRPSIVPPAAPSRCSPLPAPGGGAGQAQSSPLIRSATARRTCSPSAPGDGLDPGFAVLLLAARAARDELQRDAR